MCTCCFTTEEKTYPRQSSQYGNRHMGVVAEQVIISHTDIQNSLQWTTGDWGLEVKAEKMMEGGDEGGEHQGQEAEGGGAG